MLNHSWNPSELNNCTENCSRQCLSFKGDENVRPAVIWRTKPRHHCVLVGIVEDDRQPDKPHSRSWHVWFRKQEKGDSLGDWSDLLSAHTADDQKVTVWWTNLLTESQLDERAKRAIALYLGIAKVFSFARVAKETKVASRGVDLRVRSGVSFSWIYLSQLFLKDIQNDFRLDVWVCDHDCDQILW